MIDLHRSIDRIVSLATPTPGGVSAVLGISLSKSESSPYWDAFTSGPTGELQAASLKIGRDGSWLLFLHYDSTSAPQKDALDPSKYGPVVEVDVNPRIPPEGTESFKYNYCGASLFFEFTAKTHRLRSVSIEKQ
jgi:hypothetical protein